MEGAVVGAGQCLAPAVVSFRGWLVGSVYQSVSVVVRGHSQRAVSVGCWYGCEIEAAADGQCLAVAAAHVEKGSTGRAVSGSVVPEEALGKEESRTSSACETCTWSVWTTGRSGVIRVYIAVCRGLS